MARKTSRESQPVIPSTDQEMFPLKTKMRRVCLFSFYDEQGIVDDYVFFLLKELGQFVEKIFFYSNGPLLRDAEIALRGVVGEVIQPPNEGFDVLAYKEGLQKIDFNREGLYDEVLMVDHTCFGPVFPFAELFTEMDGRHCDFWGVTAHLEMTPNPVTGVGRLPYHLNTNFVAVRRDMLQSRSFREYWTGIAGDATHKTAILGHEAVFTEHFIKLGYVCDTYVDCKKYGTHYPAMLDIDETLIDRNPLIKRQTFFDDPRFLERYAVDLPRALRVLEKTSDYDFSLIWRNVVRSAELRTLNTNAALTSVLPDVRLKQDAPLPSERIAVCVHLYYTDMVEELLSLTDTIPSGYDFIATTDTQTKKEIIEKMVAGRKNICNVIVRVVEKNRGRDMSSLFITCRDLFIEDRYDLVCRLHTKKSPQVAAGVGNMFKRHMFENLLNSLGYTTNVLDMFHDQPWIGVAVPPLVHIAFPTMGHVWFNNYGVAEQLKTALDLKIDFDPDTPVGAFGTMFWFRPKALRKLFVHPWKWSDFNVEPHHIDGSVAHVLERMICYVAQDAGYTTQQILSSHLAGRNFAMLEYKLQKFSAALPNADFTGQFDFLDHWRRLGYPTSTTPMTMRSAFSNLLQSTRRSVAHRFPRISEFLRAYRAFSARNPDHDIH
jgi:lipopolysaccharide biosynthesis protein